MVWSHPVPGPGTPRARLGRPPHATGPRDPLVTAVRATGPTPPDDVPAPTRARTEHAR
ncbi:hypothetical protein FHU37_004265 [Allostreptomyces psammosilenae]|uniref:Uncharacterized protein n=1 Tax=Allostreptomyces psammosilenae TaxID=1892865 RepID=A0A853AAC1_9ACTN|nr:hypothetical protein [Allostreptomyces psammosilenae]